MEPSNVKISFAHLRVLSFSPSFFWRHCHSKRIGTKCHKSNSGHKHFEKKIWVFSWHCHSIKSLSLVTPLVLMKMSSGGHSAVYVWLLMTSAVIASGFWNLAVFTGVDCKGGESGSKAVVVEDIESSTSSFSLESIEESLTEESEFLDLLDRIFWVIRDCENGVFGSLGVVVYSSTVALIALVISAREV